MKRIELPKVVSYSLRIAEKDLVFNTFLSQYDQLFRTQFHAKLAKDAKK